MVPNVFPPLPPSGWAAPYLQSPELPGDVLPPLPAPGDDPTTCPVCGWNPCTDECRLGLSQWDVERLEAEFNPPDYTNDYLPEDHDG